MEGRDYILALGLFAIGYFIGFVPLVFGTLLLLAGLADMKQNHMVPDLLNAGLWIVVFLGNINPYIVVASFACLFGFNMILARMRHRCMGWADILGLPPFVAFMWTFGWTGAVACAIGFFLFDFKERKVGGPLFPYLAAIFIAVVVVNLCFC